MNTGQHFPRLQAVLLMTASFFALGLTGCSDSRDKVMKDWVTTMKKQNDIMETITDVESAKKAVPKLKGYYKDMASIGQRMQKVFSDSSSLEDAMKLMQKYQQQLMKESMRSSQIMARLMKKPEVMKIITQAMTEGMGGTNTPGLPF